MVLFIKELAWLCWLKQNSNIYSSIKLYRSTLQQRNYTEVLTFVFMWFPADALVSTGLAELGYVYVNIGIILACLIMYLADFTCCLVWS